MKPSTAKPTLRPRDEHDRPASAAAASCSAPASPAPPPSRPAACTAPSSPKPAPLPPRPPPKATGYRLTPHVLRYYETTKA